MGVQTIEELSESFSLFDDWEERYRYLIDLGRRLPEMDEALKTPESEVKGCVSKVWLVPRMEDGRWFFLMDSNGEITRGLAYIVWLAYDGKTSLEITDYNIEKAFEELGLSPHLTPNRRNGFFAMVARIRAIAAQNG